MTELTNECPCTVGATIWAVNKTVSLTQPCPPNTCNHVTLLRQPLGGPAYGVGLRSGNFLRVTKLSSDKIAGFNTSFTADDFYWVECSTPTRRVLMLVVCCYSCFFFSALAYLAAGMAINYHKTSVPRIPHAEFWTSIPGLVSDGFAFTFSCFGLLSRKKNYAAMTNVQSDNAGGYGAL